MRRGAGVPLSDHHEGRSGVRQVQEDRGRHQHQGLQSQAGRTLQRRQDFR